MPDLAGLPCKAEKMNLTVVPGLVAVAFYAISSSLALHQLHDKDVSGNKPPKRIPFLLLGWAAAICHTWSLWQLMVAPTGVALGLFPIASAISLFGVLLVLVSSLYRPLEWVSIMVFPATIILLIPALFLHAGYVSQPFPHGIAAHIVLSILAYAVMTIACCQSILIMIQHRQLKRGNLRGLLRLLPPIQTMESMLFELIWGGVILLTFAIITGLFYVKNLVEQHLAHQTVLTLVAWLIFALLLGGRHFLGWRGITAGRLTVAGFIMLLVAFFGTQVIIDLIYHNPI
jgi:ABC-type uncharacterized transport system permease subunit